MIIRRSAILFMLGLFNNNGFDLSHWYIIFLIKAN